MSEPYLEIKTQVQNCVHVQRLAEVFCGKSDAPLEPKIYVRSFVFCHGNEDFL